MNVTISLMFAWGALEIIINVGNASGFRRFRVALENLKCYRNTPDKLVTSYQPFDETWQNFKSKYGRKYPSEDEEARRREIFIENVKRIEAHNKDYRNGKVRFYMGITPFTDLTQEEHVASSGRRRQLSDRDTGVWKCQDYQSPSKTVPDNIDWVEKGYVTQVENQTLFCNSCYAFSAIASLESRVKSLTGNLIALSKQQIVDCSTNVYNDGCNGGFVENSYNHIHSVGGIQSEADYPYTAMNGKCKFDETKTVATITGCRRIQKRNEEELKKAVFHEGPISVSIDDKQISFTTYIGGIYEDPDCKDDQDNIRHSMTVVGYGREKGSDYWLLKNSQGTDWGLDGYMCLMRNKNNMCGVATEALFPIAGGKNKFYREL